MNGSVYEREIASILSGKKESVMKYVKRLSPDDRYIGMGIISRPFFVTRSAGSQGADIIALRHGYSLIIEVKSSVKSPLTFSEASGKRQEQADRLSSMCKEAGLFLTYAFRLKGAKQDAWRLFSMPGKPKGKHLLLYDILPKVSVTKSKNYMIKWEEGLPLIKFFKYVNGNSE